NQRYHWLIALAYLQTYAMVARLPNLHCAPTAALCDDVRGLGDILDLFAGLAGHVAALRFSPRHFTPKFRLWRTGIIQTAFASGRFRPFAEVRLRVLNDGRCPEPE